MLAFLLVGKRDPIPPYKYSPNKQRHPVARGGWAARDTGAAAGRTGSECALLWGSPGAAIVGIPAGAGATGMTENSVSIGSVCVLTLCLEGHLSTDSGLVWMWLLQWPQSHFSWGRPYLGCTEETVLCQASPNLGKISKESLQKHWHCPSPVGGANPWGGCSWMTSAQDDIKSVLGARRTVTGHLQEDWSLPPLPSLQLLLTDLGIPTACLQAPPASAQCSASGLRTSLLLQPGVRRQGPQS